MTLRGDNMGLYDIFKENEQINNILQSEQFQYSEKIMEMRIKLDLSVKEIAKIIGVTEEKYLDLEYSSLDIPIEEYKNALENLYNFENNIFTVTKEHFVWTNKKLSADLLKAFTIKNKIKNTSEIVENINQSSFIYEIDKQHSQKQNETLWSDEIYNSTFSIDIKSDNDKVLLTA